MRRSKFGLPLNLLLTLDDGRQLLLRHGSGQRMVCRQKIGKPLMVGDVVKTTEGKDGRKAVFEVTKRTKRDVHFYILGSCDE